MANLLPGTTVELEVKSEKDVNAFLDSLFAGGGLVLSQVLQLTDLNTHTVQNWVKRGFVSPPVAKKYNREQFCTIAILNMLHNVFALEEIKGMLGYVAAGCKGSGIPAETVPCLVYTSFCEVMALMPEDAIASATGLGTIFTQALEAPKLNKELERRLKNAMHVMVLAQLSAQLQQDAYIRLKGLD